MHALIQKLPKYILAPYYYIYNTPPPHIKAYMLQNNDDVSHTMRGNGQSGWSISTRLSMQH